MQPIFLKELIISERHLQAKNPFKQEEEKDEEES
jgi:hypothetical protein